EQSGGPGSDQGSGPGGGVAGHHRERRVSRIRSDGPHVGDPRGKEASLGGEHATGPSGPGGGDRRGGALPNVGSGVVRERSRDRGGRRSLGVMNSKEGGTMEKQEIEEKVRKVLAEQLAVDESQVTTEARFAEDLNADSLDLTEAVLALEDEMGIEIPEEEMENVKTVGQAVELVASKMGVAA